MPDFTESEDYRGQNANMHTCEAMLAAHEVNGEERYLNRGTDIGHALTVRQAESTDGLLWEHYTTDWEHDIEYNRATSSVNEGTSPTTISSGRSCWRSSIATRTPRGRSTGPKSCSTPRSSTAGTRSTVASITPSTETALRSSRTNTAGRSRRGSVRPLRCPNGSAMNDIGSGTTACGSTPRRI